MDYRCPVCGKDLGRRRLSRAILASMELDCASCNSTVRLNLHRAEVVVVLLVFAMIVALIAFAVWLESRELTLVVLGALVLGTLAQPLLEATWLRKWPRYRRP